MADTNAVSGRNVGNRPDSTEKFDLRSFTAFFLFGMCNNFPYIVMLSAAHDIMSLSDKHNPASYPRVLINATVCPTNVGSTVASGCPANANTSVLVTAKNGTVVHNEFQCNAISTGAILLADVLPSLLIKATAPHFQQYIPYTLRVVICTMFAYASFLLVSFAGTSLRLALSGVICASIAGGFGEVTYLALTSHYPQTTLAAWTCGTGTSSLVASFGYALLAQLFSPSSATLYLTFLPTIALMAYCCLLHRPAYLDSVQPHESALLPLVGAASLEQSAAKMENAGHEMDASTDDKVSNLDATAATETAIALLSTTASQRTSPSLSETHKEADHECSGVDDDQDDLIAAPKSNLKSLGETLSLFHKSVEVAKLQTCQPTDKCRDSSSTAQCIPTWKERVVIVRSMVHFLIVLFLVYYVEYFINQGLAELIVFPHSIVQQDAQYRWYQFCYRIGVFIARCSILIVHIRFVYIFPPLQAINLILLLIQIFVPYLPSIGFAFAIIVWEGLIAGATYANVLRRIADESELRFREFSLAFVTVADALGIALAGLTALPVHSSMCSYLQLFH